MNEPNRDGLPDEPTAAGGPPEAGESPVVPLSLVIPTAGRESLWGTLASITPQVGRGDEVIVVREPGDLRSEPTFDRSGLRGRCVVDTTPGPTRWGYKARSLGIRLAHNPWIHVIGDDDVYLDGGLDRIRLFLGGLGRRVPVLFKMYRRAGTADLLWREPRLVSGNVAGEMLVMPNDAARFGVFADAYDGDFHFIRGLVSNYGGELAWAESPVVRWRADG